MLQQFAAIETCLNDFVVLRNSGASDDAQLLLLLERVAEGLIFVEKWPTFKETAVCTGRLKQLNQWCVAAVCKRVSAAFDAPPPRLVDILTSSHPQILTSSPHHILTSSLPHLITSSHRPHLLTSFPVAGGAQARGHQLF